MKTEINIVMAPFVDELIAARQAIKSYFQKAIKKVDPEISYEMYQVLHVLWRKNEVNQQEIANAIQKGKASLTPLIDNLSKLNLVKRTEDGNDRRNKIIVLTRQGLELQRKFEPAVNDFYQQFNAQIPVETIREFTKSLNKMTVEITK